MVHIVLSPPAPSSTDTKTSIVSTLKPFSSMLLFSYKRVRKKSHNQTAPLFCASTHDPDLSTWRQPAEPAGRSNTEHGEPHLTGCLFSLAAAAEQQTGSHGITALITILFTLHGKVIKDSTLGGVELSQLVVPTSHTSGP